MKETLEKLWEEYLLDECAVMETEEERDLTKKALALHEKANALLHQDQQEAVEKYIDALCDLNALFVKKRFAGDANLQFRFFWKREIRAFLMKKSGSFLPRAESFLTFSLFTIPFYFFPFSSSPLRKFLGEMP